MNHSLKSNKFKALRISAISIAAAGLSIVIVSSAFAVQPKVGLGGAGSFAVLAGAGITNTGPTKLSGTSGSNIGSSPTGKITGGASITTSGVKYFAVDSKTTAAKSALVTAYNDAAGRSPATTVTADLGGQTLKAGVYNSASSLGLTGTLTLDAENDPSAVFVFQAGSTLTTASASKVELLNGAQPCNVFWQVGSSATFGTSSDFTGHVLALTSITATTGATFKGQLLARNGSVTLDTNTIINDSCLTATPAATLKPTVSPTVSPTPTATATPTPSATGSPKPIATATPTPSATPTPTPEVTPSATPTETEAVPEESATPEETTVTGGELPNTDNTNWAIPLGIGLVLLIAGATIFILRRRLIK